MLLEVRLAIPSKPKKVLQPSDFSLRSVLLRAREEERGGQGQGGGIQGGSVQGTARGSTVGVDTGSTGGKAPGPGPGPGVGGTKGAGVGLGVGVGNRKEMIDLSNLIHSLHPKLGQNPGVKPVPEGPTDSLAHSVMGRKERADSGLCSKPRHEQVREVVVVGFDHA